MDGRTISTSRGEITIRLVRESDGPTLAATRLEAIRDNPTCFGSDVAATLARDWDEVARTNNGLGHEAFFVAERDGEMVGLTGIYGSTSPKTRHRADVWSVYVRPAYRGLRLSEAMVSAAVEWARSRGIALVRLTVTAHNTVALASYIRCGFRVIGVDPAAIRWDGVYYDEIMMNQWTGAQ